MGAHSERTSYRAQNQATAQLALWTLAWTATLAIARFGPLVWNPEQNATASMVAVGLNVLAGSVWVVTFARFRGHWTICGERSCWTRWR